MSDGQTEITPARKAWRVVTNLRAAAYHLSPPAKIRVEDRRLFDAVSPTAIVAFFVESRWENMGSYHGGTAWRKNEHDVLAPTERLSDYHRRVAGCVNAVAEFQGISPVSVLWALLDWTVREERVADAAPPKEET